MTQTDSAACAVAAVTNADRLVRWEVTPSPVARSVSSSRCADGHIRVALAEAGGGPELTTALLAAAAEPGSGEPDVGTEPSWSTALTVLDLDPTGRAAVACFQSPPVLVISAGSVTWISPLLLGPQGTPGQCPLDPGDRLLAMTPSCVAYLDPRLLRTLTREAPRTRSADDLADMLTTRIHAEELSGWRRQCAYGFVIVTRRAD